MTTHNITLDLDKTLRMVPPIVTARQGDTLCEIVADVTDHGSPASLDGYTAKFQAAKPDGTYAEQAADIDGSTVRAVLAPEFLSSAGLVKTAYFRFFEGESERESTQNLSMRVLHDAEGESPDPTGDYVSEVEELIAAAKGALDDADVAVESATAAATAASDAATAANEAAQSANDAAERAESAYDAITTGNVLKRTLGPDAVLTTDDAFSAVPLGMKVYGNTRQNLWVNPSGTNNGVTVTSNEDGTITVSGTSTGNSVVTFDAVYSLKPGGAYTLSIDEETDFNSYGFYVQSYDGSSYTTLGRVVGAAKSTAIIIPEDSVRCRVGVQVTVTTEISGTYRVMLNEGDTAEPWCPPGLNSVNELEYVFEDDGEPPNISTIPIDLQGNELCSLPDGTRDVLDVVTGEIEKKTALVTGLKAKDVGEPTVSESGAYHYCIRNTVPGGMPYSASKKDGMCDVLTYDANFSSMKANTCYVQNNNLFVACDKQTVEEFKTWFDALNLSIVYKLAEPKSLQLVPPEIPALPSPNVTAYASANVEAESEMEYIRDVNVVCAKQDARIAALEEAVAANTLDIAAS